MLRGHTIHTPDLSAQQIAVMREQFTVGEALDLDDVEIACEQFASGQLMLGNPYKTGQPDGARIFMYAEFATMAIACPEIAGGDRALLSADGRLRTRCHGSSL
jgi:hypothetical protein